MEWEPSLTPGPGAPEPKTRRRRARADPADAPGGAPAATPAPARTGCVRLRIPGVLPARGGRCRRRGHRRVVRPTAAGNAGGGIAPPRRGSPGEGSYFRREKSSRLSPPPPPGWCAATRRGGGYPPPGCRACRIICAAAAAAAAARAAALPGKRARVELGVGGDGKRRASRVPRGRHRGRPLEDLRELRGGDAKLGELLFVQQPLRGLPLLALAEHRVHRVVVHAHAPVRGDVEQDAEKRLDLAFSYQ